MAELVGQPPLMKRTGPRITRRAERIEDLKASDLRRHPYWTRALPVLHAAYGGICAYACFYIEPLCGPTVDHFVAMVSTEHRQAYEWDNYRLACSRMNARKREFANVLDPCMVEDGWFVLNLGTFKVEPAVGLAPEVEARVRETIERLGLDSREYQHMCRRYFDSYWSPAVAHQPVPLWSLERDAPFLAREMRRQGRIRDADVAASVSATGPKLR
ncbi:hypothetical protein HV824_35365 [Myxococcus sp. AM009]|uniref:hypothetical protein n=1 Tax=unclassified Myxococcus TaxID=2648731 RepID=UPI001594FA85|nr:MULTISPECIES: hypothetical protein [unclassified Myxococcus]NVJ03349.1 hypothetical protein [Myxococcus sp. AM009]NVJ19538.1 hypothetical protein [Myxococcus sp. AM010]